MKLINKTILYYLLICIPLLLLSGVFAYYQIQTELRNETDEMLEKDSFIAMPIFMQFSQTLKDKEYIGFDSLSTVERVTSHKNGHSFSDTLIYSNYEKEFVPYRVFKTYVNKQEQTYLISLYRTTLEEEDLMEGLFSTFMLIIAFLIIAFFVLSWLLSKTLWKPFYNTLSKLDNYDIKQHYTYQFDKSSIKEFNQLNATLTKMTDKLYSDYIQQKEFTENASHEMQTPLAVVKANLSLLMQSPHLKEEEMNQLQSIENTVKKLTALNKALILLSKIENHQFNENISVNFNDKVKSTIKHYEDLLLNKNLVIETVFDNELIVPFNPTLADILISNLFQNAIRHNEVNGSIHILVRDKSITISNSGEPLSISETELFTRFKKNDASKDSLGLGLSIVKSITNLYSIKLGYHYSSNTHTFTLNFS